MHLSSMHAEGTGFLLHVYGQLSGTPDKRPLTRRPEEIKKRILIIRSSVLYAEAARRRQAMQGSNAGE